MTARQAQGADDAENSANSAKEAVMVGCYVYGVIPEPDVPAELGDLPPVGGDSRAHVEFVRHGGVAAAVSDLTTDRPLGKPEDLRAHARVLDTLAAEGAAVIPFRFGTVVTDARAVADEVLTEGHDAFVAALDQLKGRTQFTLRAEYDEAAVLREVLEERPEVGALREALAGTSEEAGYYDRIRLGEMVADAVAAKRDADSEEIQRSLAPLALAAVTSDPATETGITDASFLVEDARRADFEGAAEDLARRWHGRARLRLLGPLAPYDFIADAMGEHGREG